jgi:single-stranded-DNA-specific exonuclease
MPLRQHKRWEIYDPAPPAFLDAVPEHPLLVQVLYNRGLRTGDEVLAFLNRTDAVRENPYRLRDMSEAVIRLVRAIEKGETICVYGDFDADGVSSTALLVTALQAAGGRVGPYIPDRVDEGYGLNLEAVERIATQAQVMVTVDCGIRSVTEVARARALGLDVIITDHHSVGPTLPPALAVINPNLTGWPVWAWPIAWPRPSCAPWPNRSGAASRPTRPVSWKSRCWTWWRWAPWPI